MDHEINFIDMCSVKGLDQGSLSNAIKTKFMHIMMIIDSTRSETVADTTIYAWYIYLTNL